MRSFSSFVLIDPLDGNWTVTYAAGGTVVLNYGDEKNRQGCYDST